MKQIQGSTTKIIITAVSGLALILLSFSTLSCEKADTPAAEAPEATEPAAETAEAKAQKPVKHLEIPDVTNGADARKIFTERTAEITGKKTLDNNELHEIHMSTYHLEKAIAWYAENAKGPRKEAAEKMAVVVEEIHLSSESFKADEAREHLKKYAAMAENFSQGFQ